VAVAVFGHGAFRRFIWVAEEQVTVIFATAIVASAAAFYLYYACSNMT
jgi:hypothetical protein